MDGLEREGATDAAVAALAERQHGVVAMSQLRALGFGRGGIEHRLRERRLLRIHRGVYAVGHARLTQRGRWMGAVLACGPDALLSHRSAAALWDLTGGGTRAEVTSPRKAGRGPTGVARHGSMTLRAEETTTVDGIPVTGIARTILDLADVASRSRVERALEQAERIGLLDVADLRRTCELNPGRRGLKVLVPLLASYGFAPDTRSELERRFIHLCRAHALPVPACNVTIAGLVVDAVWPRNGVIVELDGFEWHRTRAAFEADRRRDATLVRAGYRVLRVTARRMDAEPAAVTADVRALLEMTPPEGPPRPYP
jgi:very-short-patch-repair endonuclease